MVINLIGWMNLRGLQMNKLEKVQKKLDEIEETIKTWEHSTALDRIKERERDEQVRKEISRDCSRGDARRDKRSSEWCYNI